MLRRRSSSRKAVPSTKEIQKQFHQFVASPIWTLPIATFIEQKSIVFDRNHGNEGHAEYRQIHSELNGLVCTLVDCFCADTEIPLAKLQEAISTLDRERMTVKQRANLEPVAAAYDFDVFVPMMMRKNVELQLQALQMIEFMCGLIPQVLQLEDGETLRDKEIMSPEETERYVLISVMRQSKEEFERANAGEMLEMMESLTRESGQTERRRLAEECERECQLVERAMSGRQIDMADSGEAAKRPPTAGATSAAVPVAVTSSRPASGHAVKPVSSAGTTVTAAPSAAASDAKKIERPRSRQEERRRASTPAARRSDAPPPRQPTPERPPSSKRKDSLERRQLNEIRRPSLPPAPQRSRTPTTRPESVGMEHGPRRKNVNDVHALLQEKDRLSTADVEARRKYLEQQRDKLLAMKREEREKQIQEVSSRVSQERPRTAKAARGAMRGSQEEAVAARRLLAGKIKEEVG